MSISSDFDLRNEDVLRMENVADAIDQLAGDNFASYTPTIEGGGSMTISGLTINYARWFQAGKKIVVQVDFTATLGGTAASSVEVSIPVSVGFQSIPSLFAQPSNAGTQGAGGSFVSGAQIDIRKSDGTNFSLDTGRFTINATFYD